MDKKNNDEKTFGEIFSNINTSNNDDKSISFNSIKEESNLEDSELKSEDLFKEASHSDDNNDSNNMTFNSIFDDDNSSSDDNTSFSDSSLEKSSSIFDKAIHDDGESDSSLISDNGDSKNGSVTDNDNSLDVEEGGLDVNPFFNNDSSNDGGLENKIDGNSNKDDKEIADGDKVDDNVTTDLEEDTKVKDSGNDNNSSFSEDKDEVEEVNPFFDNSSSNDEVSKEESSDNSSNIFFDSDDSSENKVDDNVTTDLEEAAEVKDSGNDNNPSFSEDKNEVEEVNPFFDNDNTNDNLFQNTDISNLDNNSSSDKKDNDLDVSPFFADTSNSNKKEDVNPFFDNKINLVESTSHDVSDTASKIDTSKVHNFNVKVVKKKEPIIKFILGVLSYAVFIWLLLIGITLLVYVLDIKIRAAKGDTSPPKFNAFVVLSGSMLPEIQVYDVVITKKVDAKSLKEGDVITFASSDTRFLNTIITHRIIKKNYDSKTGGYTFQTQGDNNNVADSALVQPNNIYGKVILKIPKLGYLQEFLASDGGWILVILLPCLIVISYDIVKLSKKLRGKKYKNIKVQSR